MFDHGIICRFLRAIAATWAVALPFGCAIPAEPPPVVENTATGIVRASDPTVALTVAAWLDELAPEVQARLPGTRSVKPEIWVQQRLRFYEGREFPDWVDGAHLVDTARAHIRWRDEDSKTTLCHELVHVTLDDSWQQMPTLIEEGLCEYVTTELTSTARESFLLKRLAAIYALGGQCIVFVDLVASGGISFTLSYALELDAPTSGDANPFESLELDGGLQDVEAGRIGPEHYGLGAWLVERIVARHGYDGLHALCTAAAARGERQVPPDVILAAAELSRDRDQLRGELVATLTADDLLALGELSRETIELVVAEFHQTTGPDGNGLIRLPGARVRVRFGLASGSLRVELPLDDTSARTSRGADF